MQRLMLCAAMAMPLAGLPVLSGCDREIASEREVEVKDDGTVKETETTVTETDDGVKTEETTETNRVD